MLQGLVPEQEGCHGWLSRLGINYHNSHRDCQVTAIWDSTPHLHTLMCCYSTVHSCTVRANRCFDRCVQAAWDAEENRRAIQHCKRNYFDELFVFLYD